MYLQVHIHNLDPRPYVLLDSVASTIHSISSSRLNNFPESISSFAISSNVHRARYLKRISSFPEIKPALRTRKLI